MFNMTIYVAITGMLWNFSPLAGSVRREVKEQLLSQELCTGDENVLDYVSRFRESLHQACALAKEALSSSQRSMKRHYDNEAVSRPLQPGDQVLVLLPVTGSSLSANFSGPYLIEKKISETDYVLQTPDRQRQSRVCHINMLEAYHTRPITQLDRSKTEEGTAGSSATTAMIGDCHIDDDDDGLELSNTQQQCVRLPNACLLYTF